MAVIEATNYSDKEIPQSELKIETTRGSGKGGQHKNVTDSCVIVTHVPTGIKVVRDGRSQLSNRDDAYKEIKKRINTYYRTGFVEEVSNLRKEQVGDGHRSDKRRTYRCKEGIVVDHVTNKSANIKDILRGKINLLF